MMGTAIAAWLILQQTLDREREDRERRDREDREREDRERARDKEP